MSGVGMLVVDDDQSLPGLVTAYLRREVYEVHTAMDGPGGLEAARAFKPDLILLGRPDRIGRLAGAGAVPAHWATSALAGSGAEHPGVLDRRYARGEISREEYDLMKESISG